jgi:hypothetical protein
MVKQLKSLKTINYIFVLSLVFLSSCKERYENLELIREEYKGNELKLNGYYYHQSQKQDFTSYFFLYRNGIVYFGGISDNDLNIVDASITKIPPQSREARTNWGVFKINTDDLKIEKWDIVSGGKIPTNIRMYKIENNTTIKSTNSSETYTFREFSPKPDSTNSFVK